MKAFLAFLCRQTAAIVAPPEPKPTPQPDEILANLIAAKLLEERPMRPEAIRPLPIIALIVSIIALYVNW